MDGSYFGVICRDDTEKSVLSPKPLRKVQTTHEVDSKVIPSLPPDPSESAVHGREVHVAKQKQTQKEVRYEFAIMWCIVFGP